MKQPIFISICLAGILLTSCGKSANETLARENEVCKNFEWTMPAENVDAETNGQISGGGHFTSKVDLSMVIFSYERFQREGMAMARMKKESEGAKDVLSSKPLKNMDGDLIGHKIYLYDRDEKNYRLLWTKNLTLFSIIATTEAAIAEIEGLCRF